MGQPDTPPPNGGQPEETIRLPVEPDDGNISEINSGSGIRDGIHAYIGTTGSGKTHKAIRDALTLAATKRVGVLVIDTGGAENLREIQEYRPGREAWETLWNSGGVIRIVPKDSKEFDSIIVQVDRTGAAIILIDEVAPWANSVPLLNLCRLWRHRRVSLFITTQKVGKDLEQTVLACNPVLYIFKLTNPRSIEWVEKWHSLTEQEVRALKRGEHFVREF